jgi:SAM-dependent methyltransferase
MKKIYQYVWDSRFRMLVEVILTIRGILFVGAKYTCPCCNWRLRTFTQRGISFRARHLGYCPRCHAKARHRRIWLYLEQKTNLFSAPLRLLHVSPEYCFSRRFIRMPNLDYLGVDLYDFPNVRIKMDLVSTPFRSEIFDAIICIHVLEHIEEDREALRELYRVLKPGGWAVVSVPIRLDQKTYEDPTITLPEERERVFGETDHVRFYGYDLMDRLQECGLRVHLDRGDEVDLQTRRKYGLRDDESIFHCTKA